METVHSPKLRIELVLRGVKPMKTSLISTAVKALETTEAFQY
jgi:hypothetical protein